MNEINDKETSLHQSLVKPKNERQIYEEEQKKINEVAPSVESSSMRTILKLLPASTKPLDQSFRGKTSYYTWESITGSLLAVALILGTAFTFSQDLGKFENAQYQEMPFKNNYELSKIY